MDREQALDDYLARQKPPTAGKVNVDKLVRDAADQVLAEFTEIGGGYGDIDHAKAIALNRLKDAIKAAEQPEHGTPPGMYGGQA